MDRLYNHEIRVHFGLNFSKILKEIRSNPVKFETLVQSDFLLKIKNPNPVWFTKFWNVRNPDIELFLVSLSSWSAPADIYQIWSTSIEKFQNTPKYWSASVQIFENF